MACSKLNGPTPWGHDAEAKGFKKGSTIAVFAPASPVEQAALLQGINCLNAMGFRTKISDLIFSRYHYFAGSHQERAMELNRLFADPDVDAIFCARGGYGSVHLLPYLDSAIIRSNPKIFLGYSDVTVLLQYLERQIEMVCFHGPMVAREFGSGAAAFNEGNLLDCVARRSGDIRITAPELESLRSGIAKGRLTGGCLSLIASMLGTSYEIDTNEKILFLEDVKTRPYQIDRMLMQLKLAGKFDQVRGLVFGQMLNCNQNSDSEYRLQEIISDIFSDFQFPILYGLPSGHTQSNSLTLPMGIQVTVDCDRQYLVLDEGAVV